MPGDIENSEMPICECEFRGEEDETFISVYLSYSEKNL